MGGLVGGVAASASGGKAGKGAAIGAGTNILGTVLFGSMTGKNSSRPAQEEYQTQPYRSKTNYQARHHRRETLSPVEAAYQQGRNEGYDEGYRLGYQDGFQDGQNPRRQQRSY